MRISEWLKLPETKNINNLDDPETTILHARIIQKKGFLKKLYRDFYKIFKKAIPGDAQGKLLVELGSGGGFIKEIIPGAVTSDVLSLPNVDKHFSALAMPFRNNTVCAFFMIDVLHHISEPRVFFGELERCLKIGGKAVMIEPANTPWASFIFRNFHHEPFDPAAGWGLEDDGDAPSRANSAIPWIIFYRDRQKFEKDFPALKIRKLTHHTPFRYLVSGGVSMRQLLPGFAYDIVKGIEALLSPFNKYLGMFLTIELERVK